MSDKKIKWFDKNGTWEDNENSFRQTNIDGVCHRYAKIGFSSYQLKCRINFLEKKGLGRSKNSFY